MKTNYFYLVAFVLSFGLLASCSNDDGGSMTSGDIYGKWYGEEIRFDASFTQIEEGVPIYIELTAVSVEVSDDNYIIFHEDGTATSSNSEILMEMTYKMNGIPIFSDVVPINSEFLGEGAWSKDGNILTLVSDSTLPVDYTILELSSSKLKLHTDVSQIELAPDESLPDDTEFDVNITLRR